MPARKSKGETRYYDLDQLLGKEKVETDLTAAYARVSSHDQKEDLRACSKSKVLSIFEFF